MKKSLLLSITCLSVLLVFINAQTDKKADDKNSGKFFKTYEDYLAGKPIEDVTVDGISSGGNKIKITQNNTPIKLNFKKDKLPSNWFYNPYMLENNRHTGHLMRYFDKNVFYVVIVGPISFYLCTDKTEWHDYSNSWGVYPGFLYYYSETINGDIKPLTEEIFNGYLKKYDLKEKFDQEEVEIKNNKKDDRWTLYWDREVKYINLVNEKMK